MSPTKVQQIILVTGANTGIGFAVAQQLAKYPQNHVIIGSRNADAGATAAKALADEGHAASSVQVDLSSDESIEAAAQAIQKAHGRLDVLINNAGILLDMGFGGTLSTRALFEKTLTTNVTGTACLTDALLPLLLASSSPKIVFVSSKMASLTLASDPNIPFKPSDYKAYASSKTGVNMLALCYTGVLAEKGGRVNVVCPGLVKTKLNNHMEGGSTAEEGAKRIVELAMEKDGGANATFSDREGAIPW